MEVLIVVNKCDLNETLYHRIREEYTGAGIQVISASAKEMTGIDEVKKALSGGDLCCFTGQSGAGKSTMINALLNLSLETGNISRKISRG